MNKDDEFYRDMQRYMAVTRVLQFNASYLCRQKSLG